MGRCNILLIAALCSFALAQKQKDKNSVMQDAGKIVGGAQVTIQYLPFQVSLCTITSNGCKHFCGGSALTATRILTAAHCVDGRALPRNLAVRVGSSTVTGKSGQIIPVSAVMKHERYSSSTTDNDIAILVLSTRITVLQPEHYVGLIRSEPSSGDSIIVSGWGSTSSGGRGTEHLRAVGVPIISRSSCAARYRGRLTNNMICAGYEDGGKDSCQGDSGGPAILSHSVDGKIVQVGIVSWGVGCAVKGNPGVYTNLARYVDWILQRT